MFLEQMSSCLPRATLAGTGLPRPRAHSHPETWPLSLPMLHMWKPRLSSPQVTGQYRLAGSCGLAYTEGRKLPAGPGALSSPDTPAGQQHGQGDVGKWVAPPGPPPCLPQLSAPLGPWGCTEIGEARMCWKCVLI